MTRTPPPPPRGRGPDVDPWALPGNLPGTPCREFSGPARPAGGRAPCARTATREAWFLGSWVPLCGRHAAAYSDLPTRALEDRTGAAGPVAGSHH